MTLAAIFTAAVAREPDAIAIIDGERRLTYGQWQDEISRLAGGLSAMGLVPGDHLVCVLSNRHETATLYWAAQFLGVIFTPFNWRASTEEIAYVLEDAEARAVAYEDKTRDTVTAAADAAGIDSDRLIAVSDSAEGGAVRYANLCGQTLDGPLAYDAAAMCLMLYTSGTTGRPKGVPRTGAAERWAALSCVAGLGYRQGEVSLGVMPLFHTMGIRGLLMSVFVGGTFVCMPTFDTEAALRLIAEERVSALFLVPTMFHDMVHHPAMAATDVGSVQNMSMTGVLIAEVTAAFRPDRFANFYGSSEIYTFSICPDVRLNPGSGGRAGIGQTLRVVRADPDSRVGPDEIVAAGEAGEIIASMAALDGFAGYWKRPDADEKAIRDGWYFTGDLGRFDQGGEIHVVGRVDDMIISGGENIHAEEVEEALSACPLVLSAAVIGEADPRWGERVVAFIEPVGAEATAEAIDAYCLASGLARFKRPRAYRFVRQIPRSASGKLLRRQLRTGAYEPHPDYD
jgi:2-furoate---CoA ligase